jgi:hypothetical protein
VSVTFLFLLTSTLYLAYRVYFKDEGRCPLPQKQGVAAAASGLVLESEQAAIPKRKSPAKEDLEGQESPSKHLPGDDRESSEEEEQAEQLDGEDIESARN